jgi:hypothetical protein
VSGDETAARCPVPWCTQDHKGDDYPTHIRSIKTGADVSVQLVRGCDLPPLPDPEPYIRVSCYARLHADDGEVFAGVGAALQLAALFSHLGHEDIAQVITELIALATGGA